MNSKGKHIIIVETSFILYHGLTKSLLSPELPVRVFQSEEFPEIEKRIEDEPESIVIINPAMIQFNTKEFRLLKKNRPSVHWIAFIYQLIDERLLPLFDASIHLNDPPERIIETIKNLLRPVNESGIPDSEKLLSEREIDVLTQLALGLSNKEIADKLNISINTVITHRKNISQKTGIKSVSGLTIYAVVNKLISLENPT